jgi:hypothetical protein
MDMCSNCGEGGKFEGLSRAELVVIEARLFGDHRIIMNVTIIYEIGRIR